VQVREQAPRLLLRLYPSFSRRQLEQKAQGFALQQQRLLLPGLASAGAEAVEVAAPAASRI
jgi:hypothetical protein